jgi:hypothetical protein
MVAALSLQEAKEGRVALNDEESEVVARMLSFMYTGEYHDGHRGDLFPEETHCWLQLKEATKGATQVPATT